MRIILLALCVWVCQAATEPKSCQRPNLKEGFLVPLAETYEHGTKVSYGCDPDMKPLVETWWGEIWCDDGRWSHIPRCVAITDCIAPVVSNTQLWPKKVSYPTSTTVSFVCDKGYELNKTDLHTAECKDGKWSELPSCKRRSTSCSAPKYVPNAVIIQSYQDVFEEDTEIKYICKNGDTTKIHTSTCQNSEWTPMLECVAGCKPLPTIPNGDVTEAPDGMSLKVACSRFYQRIGPEQVTCVGGRWSRLPECKEDAGNPAISNVAMCKPLPPIPNGDVTELSDGMSLKVECSRFYQRIGPEQVVCVGGRWSNLPECKEDAGNPEISHAAVCKTLPTIPNGDVHEAPDGMSLTVECARFYQLIGPKQVTCVRGHWSKLPECKVGTRRPASHVGQCGQIPTVINGHITYTGDGMEVRIQCHDHYKLLGPDRVWCVDTQWTEWPTCKVRCKLDPKMTYYYSERYMEHGTEEGFFCTPVRRVYIKCNDGRAYYRGCGRNDW